MCSHVAAFHTVNGENKKFKSQACFVVLVIKVELSKFKYDFLSFSVLGGLY